MVTTKRKQASRSLSNGNNSPNSPFKDDDDNNRSKGTKDIKHLAPINNSITGNGELPNMNITQGEKNQYKRNGNISSTYNSYEIWDRDLRNNRCLSGDEETHYIEPEIVPIKTKKVNNLETNCNSTIDKFLLPRELSISPPAIPPKQHQLQQYRNDNDGHYATSGSSGETKAVEENHS